MARALAGGARKGPKRRGTRPARARKTGPYEEGMAKFFAWDVLGALTIFDSMIADDPRNPDGHSGMGTVLAAGGYAKRALRHFETAMELGDGRDYTRLCMGNAYRMLDMHDEAAACYRDALAVRPGMAQAHFGMACAYGARGMHGDAAESACAALRSGPASCEAKALKGMALLNSGRRREGARLIAEAARAAPRSPSARMGLGCALLAGGDAGGALRCFDGVAEDDLSAMGDAHKKARALSKAGDHAGAYRAYAGTPETDCAFQTYAGMAASVVGMHSGDPGAQWRAEAAELAIKAVGRDNSYAFAYTGGPRP